MGKIAFVQKEYEDKLGPMIICAYLKSRGHDAEILINPRKSIKRIREFAPDLIGISVLSMSVNWALTTSRFLKDALPDCKIILGGPHPTFFPDIINEDCIDMICRGEGEKPLLKIMESFDGSLSSIADTPNIWVKINGSIVKNDVCDLLTEDELSEMPLCDRSHYKRFPQLRDNPHKTVLTSRGCPNNCSYCFQHKFNALYKGRGKLVRQRSVDSVIQELAELKQYKWGCLEICDDQFILNKNWIFEFCERYEKSIGYPFSCLSTAKQLKPDIVAALKKAGCAVVHFAIESGVERIRRDIYNKPIKDSDIYAAAEALHSNNIIFQTFNMVGLPEETPQDIYQTIRMNQEIKVPYPWCSIVQPYPSTSLAEYMKEHGVDQPTEFSPTFFKTTVIKDPVKRRIIVNSQRLFSNLVATGVKYETFLRLVQQPPLGIDRLYPLLFYWNYGRSLRVRHKMTYAAMFRYWLYSLQN